MLRKLGVGVVIIGMLSYASAGTVWIGTISARGDMRVDNYGVTGTATLFNGSVIETGKASADLRLDKGIEITMAHSSRGILYRDHLLLQHGMIELAAPDTFQLEADGLSVVPSQPHSRGVVSMGAGNTVEVAALTGSFRVTNNQGLPLASIHPGMPILFTMQAGADSQQGTTSFSGIGLVSYENGHYYFDTGTDVRYELTCKDVRKFVGWKIGVSGTVPPVPPSPGQPPIPICVSQVQMNGPQGLYVGGIGTKESLLIVGGAAAAIAGAALAVSETSSSTPASR